MSLGPGPEFVHATALVVGEQGILIEGPSGSGKSSAALALLHAAQACGRFARLVGDDRVGLRTVAGRLLAEPHPAITGLIEQRGRGLLTLEYEPACVLHLCVRLADADGLLPRLPETAPFTAIKGIGLPLLVMPLTFGSFEVAAHVMAALPQLGATLVSGGSNLLANSAALHKIAPHDEAGWRGAEPT